MFWVLGYALTLMCTARVVRASADAVRAGIVRSRGAKYAIVVCRYTSAPLTCRCAPLASHARLCSPVMRGASYRHPSSRLCGRESRSDAPLAHVLAAIHEEVANDVALGGARVAPLVRITLLLDDASNDFLLERLPAPLHALGSELDLSLEVARGSDSLRQAVSYASGDELALEEALLADAKAQQLRILYLLARENVKWTDGECIHGVGVSRSSDARYVWLDVRPKIAYGPLSSGSGDVSSERNMPWLPTNSVAFEQFLTELLVFVHTAAEQMFTLPMRSTSTLMSGLDHAHVVVLRIHSGGSENDISNGDRLAWLDRVLKEQVRLMPGQRITTALVEQPVSSCAECAIALELATRTHVVLDPEDLSIVSEHELFLDPITLLEQLETLLGRSWSNLRAADFVVYWFDIDHSHGGIPLLGRERQQAAVLDRAVVAVQSRGAPPLHTDFYCRTPRAPRQPLFMQRQNAGDALQYALLEAMFGVPQDWPPNGPFALARYTRKRALLPLAFTTRDATAHNQLIDALNVTESVLLDHLENFVRYLEHEAERPRHRKMMSRTEQHQLLQRYTLFRFKRDQVLSNLAIPAYDNAYYFLQSMHVDVRAIGSLLLDVADRLGTQLYCDDGEMDDDDTKVREHNENESHWFAIALLSGLVLIVTQVLRMRTPKIRKKQE